LSHFKKALQVDISKHHDYLKKIKDVPLNNTPNIVLIFVDDMGHGDISCFGSNAIHTPHLDKMATEGLKMSDFYASSPICSPSRFSVLTGRYAPRGFVNSVFFPTVKSKNHKKYSTLIRIMSKFTYKNGVKGILPDEITIAEVLQAVGYKTGMFGKWHLGDKSPFLPNDKGFDYFYGSHYSNDMHPYTYYRNTEKIMDEPVDQTTLTKTLTSEIISFIKESHAQKKPFFVYYPSPFPHHPVHASKDFQGKSKGGPYGDCVEEIDWSVGEINNTLQKLNLDQNTLVIFTSDNGPWHEGNPGYHRGRKGQTWDGGQIVPFIAKWPHHIKPGVETNEMAMNIDLFPTILEHIGLPLPEDRIIDGENIYDLFTGKVNKSPHDTLHFIKGMKSMGARKEHIKYEVKQCSDNAAYKNRFFKVDAMMFDLKTDKNESYSIIPRDKNLADQFQKEIDIMNEAIEKNPRGWIK
jgi:arylsulfatase A-like enzyme